MKFYNNVFVFVATLFSAQPLLSMDQNFDVLEQIDVLAQIKDLKTEVEDLKKFVTKKFSEIEARELKREKGSLTSKVKKAATKANEFVSPALKKAKSAAEPIKEKIKEYSTSARKWLSEAISPEEKNMDAKKVK